jgi:2-(1,2-epoxy-1,2-dihydrophenyl)acetyl-CoA isomerase
VPDVLVDKRPDGVALITLNRPESLNAMGGELMPMLGRALEDAERDDDVRCIAITGAGRGFCAGGDVKGFAARGFAGEETGRARSVTSDLEAAVRALRASQDRISLKLHTMPKPTVALVNGPAAGAGMSVALACDLRICSDRAVFVTAFRGIGFSGDFGGSYLLQRLVGYGRALEAYYTNEPIRAEQALAFGIANRVVPHDELIEQGLSFCGRLAAGPTGAYGRMKSNFNLAERGTLQEVLNQEALNMRLSGMTLDFAEGARAFVEKRDPHFTGR